MNQSRSTDEPMLPPEVREQIEAMIASRSSGSVTLHFVKGEIRSTDEHRMRRIGEKGS